nr:NUDIX domain-containing protein [Providencia sp.]
MNKEVKHFTATAMIRNTNGDFLLHEHRKLGFWLPPGGHIDPNEEPQETVVREVLEETGLMCRVINCGHPFKHQVSNSSHTQSLPMPLAILKEFIADKKKGDHWHIDMVYLCELNSYDEKPADEFHWVPFHELANLNIPDDVIELANMVNEYYQKW